ncbi:hypothetical protein DWB77_03648 [Streptomyces hundungensis]|uniref:Uncharacterized protein n=1 Tax=Streptomyces hundungensis TaxID=1077946 RepID=A0A387HL23_9ACTN|nr:hypothetical protein DWB77_03648 [Streptomyces hundungensis]
MRQPNGVPPAAYLTERAGPPPIRLGAGPDRPYTRSCEEPPVLEAVFSTLLVLVCVGVLAFAGLTVKKLYQGQR